MHRYRYSLTDAVKVSVVLVGHLTDFVFVKRHSKHGDDFHDLTDSNKVCGTVVDFFGILNDAVVH